jgi:moderate conductance mechanosensitive channel
MDEVIFREIVELFDRFLINLGHWLSDHGFEIITIVLVSGLIELYGTKAITQIFHHTVRADLYPTKIDRKKRLETLDSLIGAILRVGVVIVAGIMIISELGVNTGPLVASAGVLGVALGFGAQSMIRDLTNGIFIIVDNQYRVGDIVELNNVEGRVEAITIRTTVLRDAAGNVHHVPNGNITVTTNKTMSFSGMDEEIVFDKDADIDKIKTAIDKVGKSMAEDPDWQAKIIRPPHFERIVGFSENGGIRVTVLAKTAPSGAWKVKTEFYKRLIAELRKAKIKLA